MATSKKSNKTTAPIVQHWQQSTEDRESTELGYSLGELRADADLAVLNARKEVLKARRNVDKAKNAAEKQPTGAFNRIVEARIRLREAELTLNTAVEAYEELFGAEPVNPEDI